MSFLDQVIKLGRDLPDEIRPVLADVADAIAGIVHTLEHHGILPPPGAPAATSTTSAAEPLGPPTAVGSPVAEPSPSEPETIGSLVADAAPQTEGVFGGGGGPAPPPPPPPPPPDPTGGGFGRLSLAELSDDELTAELAARQHAAIAQADAQKTQHEGS